MSNKLTGLGQALLLAALAALLPLSVLAQQVTVNRIYDFSGNADTVNSQINYVYADSNRIIALGTAYPAGEKPHAFTAAFDYSGNLLWQKAIRLPDSLYTLDSGYNNLIKVKPGLYVAGGNIENIPKAGGYVSQEPFLYFFNAQGDSIRLLRLPDSLMDCKMSALTVNQEGNIVVGGYDGLLDTTNTSVPPKRYWYAKLNTSGQILYQNQIYLYTVNWGIPYPDITPPAITNIIPVSGDSVHYIVASNYYFETSLQCLWLDSAFNPLTKPMQIVGEPWGQSANGEIIMTRNRPFEANFIPRKGHPHSFFWSFPVQDFFDFRTLPDPLSGFDGLYFCRAHIDPPSYTTAYYHLDWYQAFVMNDTLMPSYTTFDSEVQARSELAEAVNGDLLVQREVYRPSDSLDLWSPRYHFPVLLRAGDTGLLKWGMAFQHFPTLDTGIYHNFYDLSVAPDGKIVMGGFLRSRYPVPGYDTVGKVSWLVILSDTLHDHQPQPPETEGIDVSAAGEKVRLLVYPNPTLDNTTLVLRHYEGNLKNFKWQLSDINGRILQSRVMESPKEQINLRSYSPGIYLLRLFYQGKQVASVKVMKE